MTFHKAPDNTQSIRGVWTSPGKRVMWSFIEKRKGEPKSLTYIITSR